MIRKTASLLLFASLYTLSKCEPMRPVGYYDNENGEVVYAVAPSDQTEEVRIYNGGLMGASGPVVETEEAGEESVYNGAQDTTGEVAISEEASGNNENSLPEETPVIRPVAVAVPVAVIAPVAQPVAVVAKSNKKSKTTHNHHSHSDSHNKKRHSKKHRSGLRGHHDSCGKH